MPEFGQAAFRNGDGYFLFFGSGNTQHGLAGADHLAGVGDHGGHNCRVFADQRPISRLVAGDLILRAGLFQTRLGAVEGVVLGIESGLADEFLGQQAGIALALGAGGVQVALGRLQLGAGSARSELQVVRVESGQRLAGLDLGAGIDQAGGNLAANAEGQVDLMTGANFSGVDASTGRCAGGGLNQYGADRGRRRIAGVAAC